MSKLQRKYLRTSKGKQLAARMEKESGYATRFMSLKTYETSKKKKKKGKIPPFFVFERILISSEDSEVKYIH